jgi:hypothetical protein
LRAALVVVVLLVSSFGSTAIARGQRVLFYSVDLEERDQVDLIEAIGEHTSMRPIRVDGHTRERLATLSAREAMPAAESADRLARQALDTYLHMYFGPAEQQLTEAIAMHVGDRAAPAAAGRVAQFVFERALVRLAAHREADARGDLELALVLDPALRADPDEYGPPILRLLEQAREALRARERRAIELSVEPAAAELEIDGRAVAPGSVELVAGVAHLVTARLPGYAPVSRWIAAGDERVALSLEAGSRELCARQALERWRDGAPDAVAVRLIALAEGLDRVLVASRDAAFVHLELAGARTGERVREASGERVDWEVGPFAVLAAAIDGRLVAPPRPDRVAISVSGPSSIAPGAPIPIAVRITDPEARAAWLRGRCGEREHAVRVVARRSAYTLRVGSTDRIGAIECGVRASDSEGRWLGVAPEPLRVAIAEPESSEPWIWLGVGAGGAVVVAVTIVAIALALEPSPSHVLRIHGP